jgi:large subunit ribosomal protein L5
MQPGNMITPLSEKYKEEVISAMKEKFGYKNDMAVPKIEKVVLNTGFGRQIAGKTSEEQKKIQDSILEAFSLISGQKAILTRAKKSISSFKLRQRMPVGAVVTLRGKKMTDFLERLIHLALPRSRDFRGIDPKSVDQSGNLTIAIKEHIAFPEILPEKAKNIFGLEITAVTNAKTRKEGLELFKLLGFPLKGEPEKEKKD